MSVATQCGISRIGIPVGARSAWLAQLLDSLLAERQGLDVEIVAGLEGCDLAIELEGQAFPEHQGKRVRPYAGEKLPDPDQWHYSADSVVWRGASVRHGLLVAVQAGRAFVLAPVRDLALPEGLIEIVLAAVAAAQACGVTPQAIRRGLEAWRSQFDRLELCGDRLGVQIWSDNACPDEGALLQALEAFERKVTLVTGGPGFQPQLDLEAIRSRTNRVLMLPGTPMSTLRLWEIALQAEPTLDLAEALHLGVDRTSVGGVLLVAPGCVQGQELVCRLGGALAS